MQMGRNASAFPFIPALFRPAVLTKLQIYGKIIAVWQMKHTAKLRIVPAGLSRAAMINTTLHSARIGQLAAEGVFLWAI